MIDKKADLSVKKQCKLLNIARSTAYHSFHCHQAIEKITKGYFEKYKGTSAPYTHNISKISKEVYGDPNKYNTIFEANTPMLQHPDKIYPGQVLYIPPQG